MTPALFARELAAALAASLPEGFTASAEGALVTIEPPDGAGVTTALDIEADEIGDADVYADAAEGVLSLAQDVVCEALDATWPSAGGGALDLPIPGARGRRHAAALVRRRRRARARAARGDDRVVGCTQPAVAGQLMESRAGPWRTTSPHASD